MPFSAQPRRKKHSSDIVHYTTGLGPVTQILTAKGCRPPGAPGFQSVPSLIEQVQCVLLHSPLNSCSFERSGTRPAPQTARSVEMPTR